MPKKRTNAVWSQIEAHPIYPSLTNRDRTILQLYFRELKSVREIGIKLKVSHNAIWKRKVYLLKTLALEES